MMMMPYLLLFYPKGAGGGEVIGENLFLRNIIVPFSPL